MSKLWNEETTAKLSTTYAAAVEANNGAALSSDQLEKVADQFDAPVNSVRQKLVSMKEYVAPDAKAKAGNPSSVRKATIVRSLADTTGLSLDSLEKANKQELESLQSFIDQQSAIIDSYESDSIEAE